MNTKAIVAVIASTLSTIAAAAQNLSSKPFGGKARAIPGLIEAEDFDEGEPGVAYHDTDPQRGTASGRTYRKADVDIEKTPDGKVTLIGQIKEGEWLTYSVDVKKTAVYDLEMSLAGWKAGSFRIEFDGVDKTGPIEPPMTKSWKVFANATRKGVQLTKGPQTMKVVMSSGSEILNWDSFRFVEAGGGKK